MRSIHCVTDVRFKIRGIFGPHGGVADKGICLQYSGLSLVSHNTRMYLIYDKMRPQNISIFKLRCELKGVI